MRRPCSALVVLTALAMLLSSGASTMAQDQGPAGFATGTITIGDSARGGSETVEGGRLTITDMAIDAVAEMSDPRLSGSLSWTWNIQMADFQKSTLGVAWGTGLLENDDGAWEGTWTGAGTMDFSRLEMQWWFQGQGAYEGLSAQLVLTGLEGQVFAYDAVIVEGAPPTVLVASPSTRALDEDLLPAAPAGTGADPLTDALKRVPESALDGGGMVSYVDYRAIEAARPGAVQEPAFDEWVALQDAGDASFELWIGAMEAVTAPSGRSLEAFGDATGDWTRRLGYEFFDIDRELRFGRPPDGTRIGQVKVDGRSVDGIVLVGDFGSRAIESAHLARGYANTPAGDWSLLCGGGGCEAEADDWQGIRPADPFADDPDRQDPLAVSGTAILGSASPGTVTAMRGSADGTAPSLADDPAVRTVIGAIPDEAWLRQATLLPAALLLTDVDGMVRGAATDEELLLGDFRRFALEPMPAYRLVLLADVATEDAQLTYVALAYDSEQDALAAADVLADRQLAPDTLRHGPRPLRKLFDEAGVLSTEVWVHADPTGSGAAAMLRLRGPLAGGLDPQWGADPSGLAYRLLIDLLLDRDVLWLATHSPEGIVGG